MAPWDEDEEEQEEEQYEEEKRTTTKKDQKVEQAQENEVQRALEEKRKREADEEEIKLREIEESTAAKLREQVEELKRLKEKQEERKKQREEEEKRLAELRLKQDEERKQLEDEKKRKQDEEKARKAEENERKKQEAMAQQAGRGFTAGKKEGGMSSLDKFIQLSQAHNEMSLTKDQLGELKQRTLEDRVKPLDLDVGSDNLAKLAQEMWERLTRLEMQRFDLEQRLERQDYDLKQLHERERQMNRVQWAKKGKNVEENSRHPPRVQVASKYERRTDKRSFGQKRTIYEEGWNNPVKHEPIMPTIKLKEEWIKSKESGEGGADGGAADGHNEEDLEDVSIEEFRARMHAPVRITDESAEDVLAKLDASKASSNSTKNTANGWGSKNDDAQEEEEEEAEEEEEEEE